MLDVDVEVDRRDFTVRANLSVSPGERLALFGPSGAGKTTLLEAVAGLVQPRRARITLGGRVLTATAQPRQAVPPWRRRVGLLRQDPALFPHLSVRANLCYGPGAGASAAELAGLAGVLGIGELLPEMPAALSGGQAHRVALGRLLLAHCDALLLDEPYTGLDASLRRTLTELVGRLVAERAVPAVLVAHELADAQAFADRLAVLDCGAVLQVGAPDEVVLWPASRRVAELVGYLGFVPAGPLAAGQDAMAGVHPERVVSGAQPGRGLVLNGLVTGCRPAGAGWEADLRIGAVTVTGRLADRQAPGGELVITVLDPPCFGADGIALPRARPGGTASAGPVSTGTVPAGPAGPGTAATGTAATGSVAADGGQVADGEAGT
ncbi:MAG TPA: ABC transporter ATP-binding protein [Streptosporangiaceae bacterium]